MLSLAVLGDILLNAAIVGTPYDTEWRADDG